MQIFILIVIKMIFGKKIKIERAVKHIEKEDNTKPILYFCNSDYYDIEI